jgi:phospho-N-acetylmuramoyl-pentapeptide-transferase
MILDIIKIFAPTAFAFFLGLFITPFATHFFYKYKMWKKYSRNMTTVTNDFHKIHNEKEELSTPRPGGLIILVSVILTTCIFYILSAIFPESNIAKLNFLSRSQTFIPFATFIIGALLGFWDDMLQIFGNGKIAKDDESWRKWKAFLITLLSVLIGCWFFYKLGIDVLYIPFYGYLYLGILIIPLFVIVSLATFSGGIIDGIDGLSGGVLATIFGSYALIAFINQQHDIAVFSGVLSGATLAFLWFNIPPARFYMGETGMMALTITLATIAFLTDTVLLLPIIAMPLVITSLSVIIQTISKKLRNGKRVFRVAPIHHHFEAIGWPPYKVVMRFWVMSVVFCIIGIILHTIS